MKNLWAKYVDILASNPSWTAGCYVGACVVMGACAGLATYYKGKSDIYKKAYYGMVLDKQLGRIYEKQEY